MNLSKSDLKPGDIFLCKFEHPGFDKYMEALTIILEYFVTGKVSEKDFLTAEFTILRGLIIYFDQDMYSHAAFWNGNEIVEAGSEGVGKTPIEHYKGTITDVYRFTKNGHTLNSNEYPVQPLIDISESIVAQKLPYSYNTAILMIFLCVTRWEREEWINQMEDLLKKHISVVKPEVIDLIFRINHDRLIRFFEWMADEMIRQIVKFKDDHGLVCSEAVAKFFNEAKPQGKYHIMKPLSDTFNSLPETQTLMIPEENTEKQLTAFTKALSEINMTLTKGNNPLNWSQTPDIIYTPHDIARSENTEMIGTLILD